MPFFLKFYSLLKKSTNPTVQYHNCNVFEQRRVLSHELPKKCVTPVQIALRDLQRSSQIYKIVYLVLVAVSNKKSTLSIITIFDCFGKQTFLIYFIVASEQRFDYRKIIWCQTTITLSLSLLYSHSISLIPILLSFCFFHGCLNSQSISLGPKV